MPPEQTEEPLLRRAGRVRPAAPASGQLHRLAPPRTADSERLSFEAIVASDTPCLVFDGQVGRWSHEILVARGAEMPPRTPLLNAHRREGTEDVIGGIDSFRLEGSEWLGRAELTKGVQLAQDAFRKVAAGHLTDLSVGYLRLEMHRIAPGGKARIGDYEYFADDDTPLIVVPRWTIYEVSLVPIGADPTAKVRSADPTATVRLQRPPEWRGAHRRRRFV